MTNAERAANLVSRWEHGDEKHRQWLRDTAIPDLAAAFGGVERDAVAKAARVASLPQGTALEYLSGMPAQFQLGHKQARDEAAAAILLMGTNTSVIAIDLDSEKTREVFSNVLLYNGVGSESECDDLARAILVTFRTLNQ